MAKTIYDAKTRARLMAVLDYDPATGIFRWRTTLGARAKEGNIAGCVMDHGPKTVIGYRCITFDRVIYRAARLAWLYVYGPEVPEYIDHDNRRREDDRIDNLRAATNSQNCANGVARVTNKSGYKGVSWDKESGKWKAKICVDYKQRSIGRFATAEEAAAAYETAARAAFGEFARTQE